jgi:RNA polymerase sigma factor (sigma-70 family)
MALRAIFDHSWHCLALAGSPAAIEALAQAALEPLYRFCYYRVGRKRHLCEEVVQETMLRAIRDLGNYEPDRAEGNIFPWLTGLARNEIRRVLARENASVSLETVWNRMDEQLRELFARLESEPLAAEVIAREETSEIVTATMSQLPAHYREALEAKYLEGTSVSRMAVDLGITENARPQPAAAHAELLQIGKSVETKGDQRRRVALPDGSVLYLNQKTSVTLTARREVKLHRGEIYVEAAQDPTAARFVVVTPERQLTALGTKFDVRVAPQATELLVTQGKVQVSDVPPPVLAGQQLTLDGRSAGPPEVSPAPRATHSLEWIRDLMAAAHSPLVPGSKYSGGALVAVDSAGQETRLSLRKCRIDVHVEDGFARTTIDQTYFNSEPYRMEGTFYFPLPPDASLSRLAMYVNGRLMEGGMAERQHARETFDDIVRHMKDPALLEWVDGSTFKMRVFPLEGRQEKRIILCYTQRLPSLYGQTEYRFPGGHNLPVVGDWSAHVRVKHGAEFAWSGEPQFAVTKDAGDLLLDAAAKDIRPDRAIVVRLGSAEHGAGRGEPPRTHPAAGAAPGSLLPAPRFSSAVSEGSKYLMLRFRPDLPGEKTRQRRDWIFLFESSGDRDPLLARTQVEVVKTILDNAEHDDTFTILTAATRVQVLPAPSQAATPANVKQAIALLENTHLVGALDLGRAFDAARPLAVAAQNPVLVHVGSGLPVLGERDEVALVKRLPERAAYVGIGVGNRWSRTLMKLAAARTGGCFTQINPDEQIAWRALDLLATLNTPRLLGIHVGQAFQPDGQNSQAFQPDGQNSQAFQPDGQNSQARKPDLLACQDSLAQGEELCAIARLDATAEMPKAVTVTGQLGGKPQTWTIPVAGVVEHAGYLPRTWAKLEIDRLVAEGAEKNKARIIDLSKAMYVMSPFTSLLVLENEEMYAQYHVDRGRKDHWAMYACPERIAVVNEPLAGPVSAEGKAEAKGLTAEEVLSTVLVRLPPAILERPAARPDGGGVANGGPNFEPLMELIRQTVSPKSWVDVGSDGILTPFPTNLSLTVSQEQEDPSDVTVKVFPLSHVVSHDVSERLNRLLASRPTDFGSSFEGSDAPRSAKSRQTLAAGSVKVVPDSRNNSLVVVANRADQEMIERLLEVLDVAESPAVSTRRQRSLAELKILHLQNRQPDEVLPILRQLFEIPEDKLAAADGSIRIVQSGSDLIVSGNSDTVARAGDIINTLDHGIRAALDVPQLDGSLSRIYNPVQSEVIDGLDMLVLRGNQADVNELIDLVKSIESLSRREDPPIVYPDAETWRELTSRRREIYDQTRVYPVADLVLPIRYGDGGQSMGAVALDRAGRPLYISMGRQVANGPDSQRALWYSSMKLMNPTPPEKKIIKALKERTQVDFVETPLEDVIDYLKDFHGIEIQLDSAALKEAGIDENTPVTKKLSGVSLRSALKLILDDLKLKYVVQNEMLLITTPEVAESEEFSGFRPDSAEMLRWVLRDYDRKVEIYQPPVFSNNPAVFYDLVSYAPAMRTNLADVRALLEAEVPAGATASKTGKIDDRARRLIERARGAGWQTATIDQGSGKTPLTVAFDGTGRFRYAWTTSARLREQVICDGTSLWHLYPELGIGARRTSSRFHRADFARLIPWALPPAEELARGADVVSIDDHTVAIVPQALQEPPKGGTTNVRSPAFRRKPSLVCTHLVFAPDGRLAERQLVEMPSGKTLVRESYAADGTVGRIAHLPQFRPLGNLPHIVLAPCGAPELKPDAAMVVLPLPLRSRQKVLAARKLVADGPYANWSEDDALALIAADLGEYPAEMKQIIGQRFFRRGDRRLGFYTLLLSSGLTWNPKDRQDAGGGDPLLFDPLADHPKDPLARYAAVYLASAKPGGPKDFGDVVASGSGESSLLGQLAEFHDLWERWHDGRATAGDGEQQHKEIRHCRTFIEHAPPAFAWAMLMAARDKTGAYGSYFGSAFARFENVPGLAYAARYEYARAMLGYDTVKARETFRKLFNETLESGRVPLIDATFFLELSQDGQQWPSTIRAAAKKLIDAGARRSAVFLARQVRQIGDPALAEEVLDMALRGAPENQRLELSLARIEHCRQADQLPRADALLQALLNDKRYSGSPVLLYLAEAIADARGMTARAIGFHRRAMEIEFEHLPEGVDVEAVRGDFGRLLARYEKLVKAIGPLHEALPRDLSADVIRTADRWRQLDPDPTAACQAAARIFGLLGESDLAWDYLTTPLAQQPNEAAPWADLARTLKQEGQIDLADRAYAAAFAAEPGNAQILWDRAELLWENGRGEQARPLFQQLASGRWDARFGDLPGRAKQYVGK